jgi:endothelin-converting enzyme/putative endopeptidase
MNVRGDTVRAMRKPLALALLLFACSGKPPSTTAPASTAGNVAAPSTYPTSSPAVVPTSSPGVKVTLADVGLEQSSLDRTVDPCVDVYQFTCGGWLGNNQIPPARARWDRFHEIDERNRAAIKALLEEAAQGSSADAVTQKLGDFYASCMDSANAERTGFAAIKPLLDKAKRKDAKGWLPAVVELHKHGIWVVFRADADADLEDAATHALYLDASGLGVDREL